MGPPTYVDPVETAVAPAVSLAAERSPLVMRRLPQLLQALRTIRAPTTAEADADPLREAGPCGESSDMADDGDGDDEEDDSLADQVAAPPRRVLVDVGRLECPLPDAGATRRAARRAEGAAERAERSRSPKDL